jgi:anti-anti-sigma factor
MLERSDMPYLNCQGCGLTIYSAATYATTDNCPRCDARLQPVRRLPRLEPPDVAERANASREPARGELEISVRVAAFGTHVRVRGQLMYPHAARLDSALDEIERIDGTLVIDLRDITDLDSSGLGSVMAAYVRARREGFELAVVAPPAQYRRIFELTGVDERLTLVDDLGALARRSA